MSAEVLRELAMAKVAFQLRAIEAVIHTPASVDRSPQGGDAKQAPSSDESAVRDSGDAQ